MDGILNGHSSPFFSQLAVSDRTLCQTSSYIPIIYAGYVLSKKYKAFQTLKFEHTRPRLGMYAIHLYRF